MTSITDKEFDALKRTAAKIVEERDVEYAYETLLDDAGNEIAFASYNAWKAPTYTRFDPPRPPATVEE